MKQLVSDFVPGKSPHNAIWGIWNSLNKCSKGRWVLDADIEKCFDRIDHNILLQKLSQPKENLLYRQIRTWLKAEILEKNTPFPKESERGTPQGGVISPLLANIALHGMMDDVWRKVEIDCGKVARKYLKIYRFADDFVIIGREKSHVLVAQDATNIFLNTTGLNLKRSKTRILHTLDKNLCEDGNNKFKFLGMNFCHHTAKSKYQSRKINRSAKTLLFLEISPSDSLVERHFNKLRTTIKSCSSSYELVSRISPIIRGWANYVQASNSRTTRKIGKWNARLYLLLKNWGKSHYGTVRRIPEIWTTVKRNHWKFYALNNQGQKLILPTYDLFHYSIRSLKMVSGERSPMDGDIKYWSKRLASYSLAGAKTILALKRQRYLCSHCNSSFFINDEVIYHVDHIKRIADRGSNDVFNLQILHPWCHELKTAKENTKRESLRDS